MKTKTLAIIALAGAGAVIGLENTGPVKRDCEVYQGYTIEPAEGKVFYSFDPQEVYSRSGYAKYVAEGNPELTDSLKRGNRYCFEVKDPIAPWAFEKIESISPQHKVD